MSILLITGSGGLIGSESVKFFSKKFSKIIGIDNDKRAYFFGKRASVKKNISNIKKRYKNYYHYNIDIRNFTKLKNLILIEMDEAFTLHMILKKVLELLIMLEKLL